MYDSFLYISLYYTCLPSQLSLIQLINALQSVVHKCTCIDIFIINVCPTVYFFSHSLFILLLAPSSWLGNRSCSLGFHPLMWTFSIHVILYKVSVCCLKITITYLHSSDLGGADSKKLCESPQEWMKACFLNFKVCKSLTFVEDKKKWWSVNRTDYQSFIL